MTMRLMFAGLVVLTALAGRTPPAAPNPIDEYFKAESLPLADDYEFFRRVTLDLTGRLPAPDAIRAFVADPATDKRDRLIDRLLESDAASKYAADVWLRHLIDYELKEDDPYRVNFPAFKAWLRKVFADDLPYDEFVRELIGARGDAAVRPGANFVLKHLSFKDPPTELAGRTARLFLGIPLHCAQCHDHPYEKWKQTDFWGLVGFFALARPQLRKTESGYIVRLVDRAEPEKLSMPGRPADEKIVTRFYDGRAPEEGGDLRGALAKFVTTAPDHQFARNIVNRTWAHFMGWAFVEPLDGFGDHARKRDAELLEALTKKFEEGGLRLRSLSRLILTSKAYQVASAAPAAERVHPPKPLTVTQFTNVLTDTFNLEPFLKTFYVAYAANSDLPGMYKNPEVFDLFIGRYISQLMTSRNRAPDDLRSAGTIRLALRLMNNKDLQNGAFIPGGLFGRILKKTEDSRERIDELFLALLGRGPSDAERTRYLDYVKGTGSQRRAFQDIFWVLVNSSEFYFVH